MATTTQTETWDTLATTTLRKMWPKVQDAIFQDHKTLRVLRKSSTRTVDGGRYIDVPIMTAVSSSAGSAGQGDTYDTTAQDPLTKAYEVPRENYATIQVYDQEKWKNAGSAQEISILEIKTTQARMTIGQNLNTQLNSDGTGNGGKDWLGLQLVIAAAPTTGTVHGINRATASNAFWRNKALADLNGAPTAITFSDDGLTRMDEMFDQCSYGGGGSPDLIHTTSLLKNALYAETLPHLQLQSEAFRNVDFGVDSFGFRGAGVMWDEAATSGQIRFINRDFLKLAVYSEADMSVTPFQRAFNQGSSVAYIRIFGNLIILNPRKCGILSSVTP